MPWILNFLRSQDTPPAVKMRPAARRAFIGEHQVYDLSEAEMLPLAKQPGSVQRAEGARALLKAHSKPSGLKQSGPAASPYVIRSKAAPKKTGQFTASGFERVEHEDKAAARKKREALEREEAAYRATHAKRLAAEAETGRNSEPKHKLRTRRFL